MFRIDTPNKAVDLFGAGKPGFRDGDRSLGISPTELSAAQQNALQEEIIGVIEATGGVPNKANNAQLLDAIQRLIDAQSGNYALDTGAVNAYVIALNPAIAAYVDGMTVRFKIANENTGASTLNAGAGAVALVNDAGGALVQGDALTGSIATATYIAAAGKFYLTSMVQSQSDARYVQLPQLRSYIDGLTMSTAGASATMGISTGVAIDSTNSRALILAASLNKTTVAWAVGSGNGGLDAGEISASAWYHFYLIRRPDTGVVDVIFSLNATNPALPQNYTQYRYIGSGLTNASLWRKFYQIGDWFAWDSPASFDINVTVTTNNQNFTLPVPLGLKTKAKVIGYYIATGSTCVLKLSSPDVLDTNSSVGANGIISLASGYVSITDEAMTNLSSQIKIVADGSYGCLLSCQGYTNTRGRNT
jgi:hypothetical protein